MNKRIAILIADSIYNRKGMMNAELNRITHLQRISNYDIDVFTFQTYSGWLERKLRNVDNVERPDFVCIDGINIEVFWKRFSIIDYILTVKLHKKAFINKNWQFKYISKLQDYDIVVANSTELGYMAYNANKLYGTPYFVTWHGSDIHTAPFKNKSILKKTKLVLEGAELNFMVSKSLLETSKLISTEAKSIVLYNGVNASFRRYSELERSRIRNEKDVAGKKVVAFAGHLIEVKNPQLFPEIFRTVLDGFLEPIEFWIMGTGKMSDYVVRKCGEYKIPLKMWGNIPSHDMPSMLNCVDVLILPSRNEGLPLIAIEALACGANVVGARVGGIPEAIGFVNTFPHGNGFIENVSQRIIHMLNNYVEQPLLPCYSWAETARIENDIYMECMGNSGKIDN